jgi:3-oxoadipate enol-lactonase
MPQTNNAPLAVVLVHGIGGSARVWTPQMTSLAAAGFAPVAVDLPGYGGRPAVTALDFDGLADDVEAAIAGRGLDAPVLVGHSMGGMVVQTMLRRRPRAYGAVVLACTSPAFGSADGDFQKKFVADRLGPLDAGKTMADMAPRLVERMMAPGFDPAGRALAIDVMRR